MTLKHQISTVIAMAKHLVRDAAYGFLYGSGMLAHKTRIDWNRMPHLVCGDNEMKIIFTGSSALYRIITKDVNGYFRIVKPHLSRKACIRQAVEEYYTVYFPEQKDEYESVKKAIEKRTTFKKFAAMGNIDDPYSRSRRFYLTKDTRYVGIETPQHLVEGSKEWKAYMINIRELLRYVRIAIARHKRNRWNGGFEYDGVNRQMATEAVAGLLGLERMVPHSFFLTVSYHDKELRGTLMSVAEGEKTDRISESRALEVASPALQRELNSLNVLDTITYERDHRPGNYNMILNEDGKVERLSVFDNDAAMTFAPFAATTHSGSGCSCVIGSGGGYNRPFIDKQLAESLMKIERADIERVLKPYLNRIQIFMCWSRLQTLRKAIATKRLTGVSFLLEPHEWNETTMNEELSGRYGVTYLKLFINYESIKKSFYEYAHVADL